MTERLFLGMERLLARRTARFFSQARGDVARAVSLKISRPEHTTVIGNGVDLARFLPDAGQRSELRSALRMGRDDIAVLFVARLVREKGVLELADAALTLAADKRLHVILAGATLESDRTGISEELSRHPAVAALGNRWHRLGHREDIPALLRAADIFVLPSYREGLPRSVIEAMASGLPVIAADIAACRELVRPGETGVLVPVRDSDALASAIDRLAGDAALRASYGERARDLARAEHDERVVLARQLVLLRSLVQS